jgi:hypothetical protein
LRKPLNIWPRQRFFFGFSLFLALAALPAWGQTTAVSGKIQDLGAGVASNSYVEFQLKNFGSNIPRVSGTSILGQTKKRFDPDSNGDISGVLYSNNFITPDTTFYRMCVFDRGRRLRCGNYLVNGATFIISSATPMTSAPTVGTAADLVRRSHVHVESPAATTWTINHNFGSLDALCDFYNGSEQQIFPDLVTQSTTSTVTAQWVVAQAGKAVCWNTSNLSLLSGVQSVVITNPVANQSIAGGLDLTLVGEFSADKISGVRFVGGDFSTVQAAIDSLPTGGGWVFIPPGAYTGPTTFKSGIKLVGAFGVSKVSVDALYGGSIVDVEPKETILQYTSTVTLDTLSNLGFYGLAFDFQGNNAGLILRSAVNTTWVSVDIRNSGTGTCFTLDTDTVLDKRNSVRNYFYHLGIHNCGIGIVLKGDVAAGNAVTWNDFYSLVVRGISDVGIDFVERADTNYFTNTRIARLANDAAAGIRFNSSATPAANVGANGNIFNNLMIDAQNQGAYTGVGVLFNQSRSNQINKAVWLMTEGDERSVVYPTTTTFVWEDAGAQAQLVPEFETGLLILNRLSTDDGNRIELHRDNATWIKLSVEGGLLVWRDVTAGGDEFMTYNPATGTTTLKGGASGDTTAITIDGTGTKFSIGIAKNGSGFKHERLASGTTAATQHATASSTWTFTTAFADANYTIACTIERIGGIPFVTYTKNKAAASVEVFIMAGSAVAASGTLNCIAVHD